METTQGSLTIVNAHTTEPIIYWNGAQVSPVTALKVVNGVVTLTVPEDPLLAELQSAGIIVRRV